MKRKQNYLAELSTDQIIDIMFYLFSCGILINYPNRENRTDYIKVTLEVLNGYSTQYKIPVENVMKNIADNYSF